MEIPEALIETFNRWQDARRPSQVRSSWRVEAWAKQMPEHETFLKSLREGSIGREDCINLIGKVTDEESAIQAFLLAMIWGYGPVGYGPYRTHRVLAEPKTPGRLLEVAQVAQSSGGLAAFNHISMERKKDRSFLKFLGPAFGTKYIYFLTAAITSVETTPVMDAVVRGWFRKNVANVSLNVIEWRGESYRVFLDHLRNWARELGEGKDFIELDVVEYLIFASGANFERRKAWSEEWDRGENELTVSELLDRLKATCDSGSGAHTEAIALIDELEKVLEPQLDVAENLLRS